jgi:GNAT superfamily N-acetyltransferase
VSDAIEVRAAQLGDVEAIFGWIVELAEYERARDEVRGTPVLLSEALFGARPSAEAVVAALGGQPVGFALFHATFSTWECKPGIWLEDLYVPPEHRRAGVGSALLAHLAALTVRRGCARLEWAALEWNTPALDFYERLGAIRLDEWRLHRLHGEALTGLAGAAQTAG